MAQQTQSSDRLWRLERDLERAVGKTAAGIEKLGRALERAATGSELGLEAAWSAVPPGEMKPSAAGYGAPSAGQKSVAAAKRWEQPLSMAAAPGPGYPAQAAGPAAVSASRPEAQLVAAATGLPSVVADLLARTLPAVLSGDDPLTPAISGIGGYMSMIEPERFRAGAALGGQAGTLGGIVSAAGFGSTIQGGALAGINPTAAAVGLGLDWLISSFKTKRNNFAQSQAAWQDIESAYGDQQKIADRLGRPDLIEALPDPEFWVHKKHGIFGQVTSKTQYLGNLDQLEAIIDMNAEALEQVARGQMEWSAAMDEYAHKLRLNLSDFDETHEQLAFVNQVLEDYGHALNPEQLRSLEQQQELLESPALAFRDEVAAFQHEVRMGRAGAGDELEFWRSMLEKYSPQDGPGLARQDIWKIEETIHNIENRMLREEPAEGTRYYAGAAMGQSFSIEQNFSIGAWLGDEAGIERLAAEIGARIRDLNRNSVSTTSGGW